MRVLMLHNRYLERGGEDVSFEKEMALLREKGCEVTPYEENNQRIKNLGLFRTGIQATWSRDTYRRVRKQLRERRYDVLHVQNFFPLISPSVYYAARAEDTPVVQTLHQYRLLCPVGTLFRAGRVCEDCLGKAFPWPGVLHGCYRNSRAASGAVATMLSLHRMRGTWENLVDVYIALTNFGRDKFIGGGLPAERIMVKPNFVFPDPQPGPGDGGYALFIGRLVPEKGIETLLAAWQRLGGRIPLKIVGDGPLAPRVADAAKRVPGVQYLGWQPSPEVLSLMGEAEFLVLPSSWYEGGQPIVAIEAFATGTPVIASRLGAMAEVIDHGQSGLLFHPGDPDDLVSQVDWALRHGAQLSSMRARARSEFEMNFTAERNYHLLMEIYEAAITRARDARPS